MQKKEYHFTMLLLKKENGFIDVIFPFKTKSCILRKMINAIWRSTKALSVRAINHLTIVKPETILNWQRRFIKSFWSYKHKTPGRKSEIKDIKALILEMKQKNLYTKMKVSDFKIKSYAESLNSIKKSFFTDLLERSNKINRILIIKILIIYFIVFQEDINETTQK